MPLPLPHPLAVSGAEALLLTLLLPDIAGEGEASILPLARIVAEVGAVGVGHGDGEVVGETEAVGLGDGDCVVETVGEGLAVRDCVEDGETESV